MAGAKITASQIVADARNESLYPTVDYKPGRPSAGLDTVAPSTFLHFATAGIAALFAYVLWVFATVGIPFF